MYGTVERKERGGNPWLVRLALGPLLLLGALASAQPRTSETIEVSIVNVDVLVTDKKGNRVTGLTAGDFEIREEGKLQPITNFAEYAPASSTPAVSIEPATTGVATEAAPGSAAAPRTPRIIVVFVESVRLTPAQSREVFQGIRDMLRKTVAAGDRATIVTWRFTTLVRQPFTDDLPSLERVLETLELESTRGPRGDDDLEVRRQQAENDATAAETETGAMPPVDALEAAKRQLFQIKQKAFVLEALMQGISGLDGRKILIMAMRRFGVRAGAEFFGGGSIPMDYWQELDTVKIHDSLIRTANAHGITLYPVYPLGLRWRMDDSSVGSSSADDLQRASFENNVLQNESVALVDLAERTGGLMAWGAGNIARMLPSVADDLDAYYSLGYRARATGKDVTRKIVVRTKNPDYEVRSRRQFVEKSDQSRMNDRVMANLYQPLQGSTIRFEAGVGQVKADGRKRWELPLRVRIPIASLTALPEGRQHAGEFSVYVVTGAVLGVTSDIERRAQPFRIPLADLEKAKTSFFTYDFTLRVDEKVDRVSVGVLDEVSKEFGLARLAIPPRAPK